MNARKYWFVPLLIAVIAGGAWLLLKEDPEGPPEVEKQGRKQPLASAIPKGTTPVRNTRTMPEGGSEAGMAPEFHAPATEEELSVEDQQKAIDRDHMTKIRDGIFAYREKHGKYPEYLSQLVPDFIDAETITSPKERHGIDEHSDPGLKKPYYGYEFSNLEFRDGRTFAEIKDIQRSEWGDVVPLLRAFGYSDGKVINMAYGGEIYETQLNWEWDPATLDVVEKLGWGPGLDVGAFTEVAVRDAAGNPVKGASVYADGRSYSFDLPNRPFETDENGIARIPLGADLDRTALALRVEGAGIASQVSSFERGAAPENHEMTVTASTAIGGRVVDAVGEPVTDTWVFLRNRSSTVQPDGVVLSGRGANLGTVKTDAVGNWTANLHPDDASAAVEAIVATPGMRSPKYSSGQEIDNEAAARGEAIITVGE